MKTLYKFAKLLLAAHLILLIAVLMGLFFVAGDPVGLVTCIPLAAALIVWASNVAKPQPSKHNESE